MKRWLCLLLLALLCGKAALAEEVCVEENWRHVQQEEDCGDVRIVVDAQVMVPAEGAMVQNYHLGRLSSDFMQERGQAIDWASIGCDTSRGRWRKPNQTFEELTFTSGKAIYPYCSIGALGFMDVQAYSPEYIYATAESSADDVQSIGMEGLTEAQVRSYAAQVAQVCGCRLGRIIRFHQVSDADAVREGMEKANRKSSAACRLNSEAAAEYCFAEVYYPVYFQGLRLYSGSYQTAENGIEVPPMLLRMAVTAGHGLAFASCPLLDPDTLAPEGEAQAALSPEAAMRCLLDSYETKKQSAYRKITVYELVLEYLPMTGDVSVKAGYTLCPAWVARCVLETASGQTIAIEQAVHAVTGERLL